VLRLLFHSWCVAYLQEFWEFYTELCYFNCFQSFYLSQHNNCQHHDPRPYPLSHQLPFQIFGLSRYMHKWYKLSVILKQFENIRKYKLITLFTLNWTKCNILAVHISCVLPTQMHLMNTMRNSIKQTDLITACMFVILFFLERTSKRNYKRRQILYPKTTVRKHVRVLHMK